MSAAVIWFYAQLFIWQHAAKWAARLARWAVTSAVMITTAPVTAVAAAALLVAWLRGWPAARLRRAAAWTLPMTTAWFTVQVITTRSLPALLAAPLLGWAQAACWYTVST